MNIVLASQSVYRKRILEERGYSVTADPSNADEDSVYSKDAAEHTMMTAKLKAETVAKRHPDSIVVAIDTMVDLNGEHIGKPKDEDDARQIIRMLSENTHHVCSGVYVINTKNGKNVQGYYKTNVDIRKITESELEEYIATGFWKGIAAGYSLKYPEFTKFITTIDGCRFNVEGIPIDSVVKMIEAAQQ